MREGCLHIAKYEKKPKKIYMFKKSLSVFEIKREHWECAVRCKSWSGRTECTEIIRCALAKSLSAQRINYKRCRTGSVAASSDQGQRKASCCKALPGKCSHRSVGSHTSSPDVFLATLCPKTWTKGLWGWVTMSSAVPALHQSIYRLLQEMTHLSLFVNNFRKDFQSNIWCYLYVQ